MRDIKKEYKKYVIIYFLVYIAINILIIYSENWLLSINWFSDNEVLIKYVIGLFAAPIISIFSLIILNCLPNKIKNMLIFWRLQKSLPSYRWMKIIKGDDRINKNNFEKKYTNNLLPQEQHDIWYKIYKANAKNTIVLNSQKDYLFARDLSVATIILTIVIIILGIIAMFKVNLSVNFIFYNLLILGFIYMILVIVSRNSANRFVCNVLAIENFSENK